MIVEDDFKKLEIPTYASLEEVKRAYYQKAQKLHPDKRSKNNLNIDEEFKELNTAYHKILEYLVKKTQEEENQSKSLKRKPSYHKTYFTKNNDYIDSDKFFNDDDFLFSNTNDNIFSFDLFFVRFNRYRTNLFSENQKDLTDSNITLKKCPGGHEKYTICLKCLKQGNF